MGPQPADEAAAGTDGLLLLVGRAATAARPGGDHVVPAAEPVTGINPKISPALVCLARHLPVACDLIERPGQLGGGPMWVKRCAACGDVVYPPSLLGRLGHLLSSHGYRMDGRRFDGEQLAGVA